MIAQCRRFHLREAIKANREIIPRASSSTFLNLSLPPDLAMNFPRNPSALRHEDGDGSCPRLSAGTANATTTGASRRRSKGLYILWDPSSFYGPPPASGRGRITARRFLELFLVAEATVEREIDGSRAIFVPFRVKLSVKMCAAGERSQFPRRNRDCSSANVKLYDAHHPRSLLPRSSPIWNRLCHHPSAD